jgi:cytochrome oxidase Cu insertion factor (SCO1/SenC/PrrC family)
VNPAEDTPEEMDRWIRENGFDAPNWWFLTGDEETIRDYMIRYFKFFGVRENTDPAAIAAQGKYSHDQRLAVVDGKANVRGFYDVLNPDTGPDQIERLWKDLEFLLDENEKAAETGR